MPTLDRVRRTFNQADGFGSTDLLHASIGLSSEAGELLNTIKKGFFYGQQLDIPELIEELGDLSFYLHAVVLCLAKIVNDTPEKILEVIDEQNELKLQERYPNGFSTEASVARADKVPPSDQYPRLADEPETP